MNQEINFKECSDKIKQWGKELGFQQIGITDTNLAAHEKIFNDWLSYNYHGQMHYMQKHGTKRTRPQELIPGTIRIIMARINYLPKDSDIKTVLQQDNLAAISRYALGKDYHKLIRKKLNSLAKKITDLIGPFNHRVFSDSGPVLEKALAAKAGLGWFGKHSILLNRNAGSYFFLGTIYTDLPLPIDQPVTEHCGSCSTCIDICPTKAIVAPKVLDARKCISYLTIEHKGIIDESLRKPIGNRIFGCDDCQAFCPWNKFAQVSAEPAFQDLNSLAKANLLELFSWSEEQFLLKTTGSALRRAGYNGWLRNIAIAIGNSSYNEKNIHALKEKLPLVAPMVQEHIYWAIDQQQAKSIHQ